MKKCLRMLTLTAGVLLCGFAATEAKAGLVTADAGTFAWAMTSNGAGSALLVFTQVELTNVKDGGVDTPVAIAGLMSPLAVTYSQLTGPPPTGSYTFSFSADGLKNFGAAGANVVMSYHTVAAGTNTIGSLGIVGTMSTANPVTNLLPGHDFTPFSNGGIISLSLSDVGVDLGLALVSGTTVHGTGGFTELAAATTPEPASWALLGIGMTGFLAFRRYFKKTSVA